MGVGPEDTELAAWLRQGCAALVAALSAAPADLECWSFLPAPSPLAMWARRQAHETAIHRVDAELAAGSTVSPFAPPFAADGVDELLTASCRAAPPSCGPKSPPPWRCAAATSTPSGRCTSMTTASRPRTEPATTTAACTVTGAAGDLYLALWNRAGPDALVIDGDASVLDLFLDRVNVRWS